MRLVGVLPRRRYLFPLLLGVSLFMFIVPIRLTIQTQRFISLERTPVIGTHNDSFIPKRRVLKPIIPLYNGIPKIIHQTWKNDIIPEVFHDNVKGLVSHNKPPDWKYYFWTDVSAEKFIREKFPKLSQRYSTAKSILKADILRLAVLYHYGGVYFDLDTVSVKPLDPYVETHNCSFTTDPPEHLFNHFKSYREQIITNCVMLCKPGNWFVWHIMEQLFNQSMKCKDAIACTGPGIITKEYERLKSTNKSKELPPLENYELFTDKMTSEPKVQSYLNKHCVQHYDELKYEWSKEICRGFVKRGGSGRNISEKAFTYHTWFHTSWYPSKIIKGSQKKIQELVPNVTFYPN